MTDAGVDTSRRRFLTATTSVVGAVGSGFAAVPFISAWQPTAEARAVGAPVQIDVSKLEPGQLVIDIWRRKPIWVLRRDEAILGGLDTFRAKLRDPESAEAMQPAYAQNDHRSIKPEYLVLVGLCTHLGCSPTYIEVGDERAPSADWNGGFWCPCHGSRFDLAGRVFQGVPAPLNLEVPPHRYVAAGLIEIGIDQESA